MDQLLSLSQKAVAPTKRLEGRVFTICNGPWGRAGLIQIRTGSCGFVPSQGPGASPPPAMEEGVSGAE